MHYGSNQTAIVKLFSPLMRPNHRLSPSILASTTSGILMEDRYDTVLTEADLLKEPTPRLFATMIPSHPLLFTVGNGLILKD